MVTDSDKNISDSITNGKICSQAGYLPIPLGVVPPESLAQIDIYLAKGTSYSLYSSLELNFTKHDVQRLIDSGVEFAYVSIKDHHAYYRTMENTIQEIVADPNLQKEKKTEILYATSIELANQILSVPPGKEEINRAANIAQATVQLILKDSESFSQLFETFNHDFYTASHMVNVCSVSVALAQKMGVMDPDLLYPLGTGSLLHDVGKIFIPIEILNSEKTLNSEQMAMVRSHVERGCEHLASVIELPPEVMAIVAEHHERIDGSGYPKGLKHDEISPFGKLAGIVDSFDAMTSVRPYRKETYSVEQALGLIEDDTPDKFDKDILRALTSLVEPIIKPEPDQENPGKNPGKGKAPLNQLSKMDLSGPKHTQYFFRIPIIVRKLKKIQDRYTLGPEEKMIAHKISCSGIGLLSPHPMPLNENIHISGSHFKEINLTKLVAVVIGCRDHGDGWYSIDTQFHQPQSPEIINKLRTVTDVREVSPLLEN